jgi:hypothetical protein
MFWNEKYFKKQPLSHFKTPLRLPLEMSSNSH